MPFIPVSANLDFFEILEKIEVGILVSAYLTKEKEMPQFSADCCANCGIRFGSAQKGDIKVDPKTRRRYHNTCRAPSGAIPLAEFLELEKGNLSSVTATLSPSPAPA